MPRTMTYAESIEAVRAAISRFPPFFRMKRMTGTFRIDERASYVNDDGVVMLYLYVRPPNTTSDCWEACAKGTEDELRAEIGEEVTNV